MEPDVSEFTDEEKLATALHVVESYLGQIQELAMHAKSVIRRIQYERKKPDEKISGGKK